MNEFNTKLIELLERIAGSIQCQPDERVIELFKELKEMNEQEIKQEQAIKPFLQSCPLKSLKTHDRELVKEVCEKIEDWCNKNFNWVGNGIGYDGQDYNEMIGSNNTINKLRGFLNQVQKEFEYE